MGQLTVHPLQFLNDLPNGHLVPRDGPDEPRENGRIELDLLFEILLCPSIVLQPEFWWGVGVEVGVGDTEGVEVGNVVSADLVRADEELDLELSANDL